MRCIGANLYKRGCNDNVRTSELSARAQQQWSVGSVFDAFSAQNSAYIRRAARRLMAGAQQISSRLCTQCLWVLGGYSGLKWWRGVPQGDKWKFGFVKGDEMLGHGPKCDSWDGGQTIFGFNLTSASISYQFLFLNLPTFLLKARDPWICGGFHLTEMVLHTTLHTVGDCFFLWTWFIISLFGFLHPNARRLSSLR